MKTPISELTNKGDKPTRHGFGEGVLEAAKKNQKVVGVGADITGSVKMNLFADAFPKRFYSLGIAEQNCMGVAAGLAQEGKVPVFSTYGVFSAMRTTDFVRISVCYNALHVVIGGAHAGISVGPDGATHQALEDIAIMRSLPNMTVVSPCDATQAKIATEKAINALSGPVYIRFGREAVPDFTSEDLPFDFNQAQLFRHGNDLTIIATGHMTWEAMKAAQKLSKQGMEARVINLHTIKPIDKETIRQAALETGAIVTIEEHQVHGGMGSAVAEVVVKEHPVPMEMLGMPDCFGESGQPDELLEKYGMSAKKIEEAAQLILTRKRDKI
ncbi:MAG: transketolase family protein [Bacteroidales bacterium]|nr:transketolase family protein [Bacteroidales bacterium]